ncbi:MAG TPA: sigma-54 dependent transcriptional regulator [Candidatus Polarisedimenticolia bacterium]|nr:sigma-54 dependent transcriptional regulator [Candidatus Polarisedimenticolia bacterium]
MKLGALDFLLKPLDVARVRYLVQQALEMRRLMETPVELPEYGKPPGGDHQLIGRSTQMLEVYKAIGRVAPQKVAVLIRGESGTGKELIARAIYQHSDRRGKPFLAVNCAALPETLLESELFGHEKGSFTGADHRRIGKFEQCNGGTIFLDEVGDMPPLMQAKLLRLLQEQRFERVGGTRPIDVDLRIVAATNRDLGREMAAGRFREDLYFRLNVITMTMPPLRERREDIPALCAHFLKSCASETKRPVGRVSREAARLLEKYDWPGNVRELRNTIERAVVLGQDDEIVADDLPAHILDQAAREVEDAGGASPAGEPGGDLSFHARVRRHKAELIRSALSRAGGRQRKAAELMGLNPTYLSRLIRNLGIKDS